MVHEYKAYRLIPLMTPLFNGWTIPLNNFMKTNVYYLCYPVVSHIYFFNCTYLYSTNLNQ
jgi:hypothetical protein